MENISFEKNIDKSFYLTSEQQFQRISEIMNLMPAFAVGTVKEYTFVDTYYETPEYFLKNLNATIRIRKTPEKQTLSIVCNELGTRREFEMEMAYGSQITDQDEYILFLEDKIQDTYTHKIDIDVIRILHHLKPFLVMTTLRKSHEILNSREFRGEVDFDRTKIETKRNTDWIYVVEFKNKCFLSAENEQTFERFVKEFQRRVVLIPMGEKKLDAGMRVVNREW